MSFYSTNNKELIVDLKSAVMQSLAIDKGLFMPTNIPSLEPSWIRSISKYSFNEIAYHVSDALLGAFLPKAVLQDIVQEAINFEAPVKMLNPQLGSLELWHGPSLAFKDFGARFMAGLMAFFVKNEDQKLTILVATSGDTGGAVAAGFYKTPGIDVIILYPSGKVSPLQEKQLTTLGENITALEITGSFDDCQALVKEAFLDPQLNEVFRLSSANSINIARLIPQSFYFFEAYKQIETKSKETIFSVPSGNFGNLTAGLIAKKMGLPIHKFIAATNINKVVPDYLTTGQYTPKASIPTISNAMDVGSPSNFTRILDLYHHDYQAIQKDIQGFWLNDVDTKSAMLEAYEKYGYICDPHGAIAYKSLAQLDKHQVGIFLETAHPAKFMEDVEAVIGTSIDVPERLSSLQDKEKKAVKLNTTFNDFKSYLLSHADKEY